ncbi:sigma-70 family RNA polymerase sigma factor [Methylibium rhizosphaerae]|uniref:sigma-70 family RNA polymerase sigma factor n=1 Tax=Methylibium rhizosphaerae TaxID=2570323 RepID=UPI001127E12C|nr:sigma-70 family RNA polymerase sigma factor [Methylibium rhizosphaerae]
MRGRLQSIFREHYAWLRDQMRRHAGSHHSAEDVASEAFLHLAQHRDLEQVREPRALLTTIAKRVLFETWRRRDLEQAYLETLALAPQPTYPSPEEQALVVEALLAVDAALDALPDKVRRAFLFSQLDAMTYAEIGKELGVSASMVRQYMTRALTAISAARL